MAKKIPPKNPKKFTKDYQPGRKKIAETKKKKRELTELLSLAIKGEFGKEINAVLINKLGIKANTIEEALHFVQIAKAIGKDDTAAYVALMQTSGLNKPIKIEQSGERQPTIIKTSEGQIITF